MEYIRDGAAIYARSFAIIRAEADLSRFSAEEAEVAVWMIHACELVAAAGQPELLEGVRVHLSGCGKRCAQPAGACVSLVAGEPGNEIVREGMAVPAGLRGFLERVPGAGQRPARPTHPPASRPLPLSRAGA